MRKAKISVVLSVIAALLFANLNSVAHTQGDLVVPGGVAAQNTGNPGEVRIGWDAYSDVEPIIAAGGDWLGHFASIDIANRNQTGHTITRLTPGLPYDFIVAGNDGWYGTPQWSDASEWQFMTPEGARSGAQQPGAAQVQADQPSCPPSDWTVNPRPVPSVRGDYDADDDGLIEVANLAQLDVMRFDLSGRGSPSDADLASYFGAFPNAVAGMGCPADGCTGFELVMDLDFDTNGNGRADAGDAYWNDGAGWLPIDNFGGRFVGGGHTIANLYINREFGHESERRRDGYGVGLFGSSFRGAISDVALTAADVTGGSDTISVQVGGLFGYGYGSISDSCVEGAVTRTGREYGNGTVGGLAGTVSASFRPYGKISGSFSTATVSGVDYVGGLVGHIPHLGFDSVISDSYATGAVSGGGYVGGLVGSGGNISGSYSTGAVEGGYNVGGLVGEAYGSIDDSYASGDVSGGSYLGGLVGSSKRYSSISASYASGTVAGTSISVGGLVGRADDTSITDSYAMGAVSGRSDVGGLVGVIVSRSSITKSYATGSVSGVGGVGGLVGDASGTISDSYATGNVLGDRSVGGLVGTSGSTIIASNATGNVDARGNYAGGLVGFAYTGSSVSGSYATGAVTTNGDAAGGLAGSGLNISGSYAAGPVSGANDVGGLVGRGNDITASYATGPVSGTFRVGGLIGQARGETAYSYAVGRVLGSGAVGGLIGDSSGTVTDSYWDTVTSGQSHSDGGTGKNTSELQAPTGYTGIYANWNVDVDGDTSPDDPWDFGTSSQYPALKYGGLDVSAQRGGQTQTPEAPAEDIPLGPPTNVQATVSNGDVTITWTDGASADRHIAILFDTNWQFAPAHLGTAQTDGMVTFRNVASGMYNAVVISIMDDDMGNAEDINFGIAPVIVN